MNTTKLTINMDMGVDHTESPHRFMSPSNEPDQEITFKMDGAESGSPQKSLRNMMDEISPAKYEGSLTKITQSPGDSGEQTFADKPIGIDSVIKKELDKIERIMVLESRWSGQYTLMPTLKSSPKNTKSQKKFGLLAK